jgi:alkaline phosphatase D
MQILKTILSRRFFISWMAQSFGTLALGQARVFPRQSHTFRIGFGSCLRNSAQATILDQVLAFDPHLFVWLGDNIYGDTENMDLLRKRYAVLGNNPRFQRLRQHCPNLSIWDDHDYGSNNAGQEYPKKAESRDIFLDFWGVPHNDPRRSHSGIYGSYLFGQDQQTIQILLLDGRSFRTTKKRNPSGTMLGAEQWRWLESELLKPSALKIICSGIQVVPTEHGYESWSEFPHERQRLFEFIQSHKIPGVIFTSGDQHWAEISKLDGALGYPAYDLTASSLDQSWPLPRNSLRVGRASWTPSFGMIVVDWGAVEPMVHLQIITAAGEIIENHGVKLESLR